MSRILVIDDSRSSREVIAAMLSEAGHEAQVCMDGKCARGMLERERFDLIVTDIYMPDKDGLEIIREEHLARPNTPIIAISGITGPRSMLRIARHLGACQTVQKPFTASELLAAVDAALALAPTHK